MSERLFLEEMTSNPHTFNEWMDPNIITVNFLKRRCRKLEDEIRYLKRERNKSGRTIKRMLIKNKTWINLRAEMEWYIRVVLNGPSGGRRYDKHGKQIK
jgi:hypothetical protein